ncbi:hypothetical protein [Hyphobacterium marinum]|uniref:TonB-dependent receptor n=1 Tax=Hyphobacterium marinum TaxID=3116574 RepID=A0ABU7M043_9PROT|nr:hypothetical protein [Hyphobacterium sp. Y6023]MEE2566912.1 hypothetical protein [Hyphobacterium sp. Y6023]
MKVDRLFLLLGLLWLLGGMALGEHMGRTQDHGQMPTHAHMMLVGGVLSILWAMIYRVWSVPLGIIAWIHLIVHQAGAAVMIYALFGLYGEGDPATYGPIAGMSAVAIMLSALIMLIQAFRAKG